MALQLSLQLYGQMDLVNYANNMAETDARMQALYREKVLSKDNYEASIAGFIRDWKQHVPPEILWADIPPVEKVDIILRDYIN